MTVTEKRFLKRPKKQQQIRSIVIKPLMPEFVSDHFECTAMLMLILYQMHNISSDTHSAANISPFIQENIWVNVKVHYLYL